MGRRGEEERVAGGRERGAEGGGREWGRGEEGQGISLSSVALSHESEFWFPPPRLRELDMSPGGRGGVGTAERPFSC